ncbi:hypothetical protein HZH66_014884 [Vespula vulgaris]|uniref:Uncharacterized protein n=1 Tax=Vespula vulgaris TaxID=7454 RepID=A0A834IZ63_VESVU|nr:hypothetical protein HZH66_014884 [Vespula vulgaris]
MDLRLLRIPELLYKFCLAGTFSESGSDGQEQKPKAAHECGASAIGSMILVSVPWKIVNFALGAAAFAFAFAFTFAVAIAVAARRSNTGGTNNKVIPPIGNKDIENSVYIRSRLKLIDRSAFATYRRYVLAMSGLSEPVELEAGTAPI